MTKTLQKISSPLCQLGEGLCWHQPTQTLFWLDIEGHTIHRYDPQNKQMQSQTTDKFIGMITGLDNGGLRAFADGEIWDLDITDFTNITWIKITENFTHNAPDVLVNDGKADRFGGLVVGCKHTTCEQPTASLYYFKNGAKQGQVMASNITVCNGPAFSPDGKTMYFADTPTGNIMAYDYEAGGHISNERIFVRLSGGGIPDGMTVDADGYLWNAEWGGSCVKRYNPNGTVERIIEMPVPHVTNVCFGGDDLKTLFITTAFAGMDDTTRKKFPDSGATYQIYMPDITGLLEPIMPATA